jgi:HEAT repeat protein
LIEVVKAGRGRGSQQFKFDEAIVALGKLGPIAIDAAPALSELVEHSKSEDVKSAAIEALGHIRGTQPSTRPAR